MGRMYVASVLLAITGKSQPAKVAEVELEPIVAGAWAAWAKRPEAAPTARSSGPTTAPAGLDVKPALSSQGS